jgi:hypothetical protein
MQRTAVEESSSLSGFSYNASTGLLEVEFRSGGTYRYFNVSVADHAALLAAESKGQHFNSHIRNCFPHQKLRQTSRQLE